MFNIIIKATNLTLSAIWLAFILSLLSVLPDTYNTILVQLGKVLLVIHVIEYVVLKLKTAKEISFFKTLLFGYGHWLPIIRR